MLRHIRYDSLYLVNCLLYCVLVSIGIIINDYYSFADKYSLYRIIILIQIIVCLPLLLLDHSAHYYAFRKLYTDRTSCVVDFMVCTGILVYSVLMYKNLEPFTLSPTDGRPPQVWQIHEDFFLRML